MHIPTLGEIAMISPWFLTWPLFPPAACRVIRLDRVRIRRRQKHLGRVHQQPRKPHQRAGSDALRVGSRQIVVFDRVLDWDYWQGGVDQTAPAPSRNRRGQEKGSKAHNISGEGRHIRIGFWAHCNRIESEMETGARSSSVP